MSSSWVQGHGWLYDLGFRDIGGAAYINMLGGACGFVGSKILGPRAGKFETKNNLVSLKKISKSLKLLDASEGSKTQKGMNLSKLKSKHLKFEHTNPNTKMHIRVQLFR